MVDYINVTVEAQDSDENISIIVFVDKITTIVDQCKDYYNCAINLTTGGTVRAKETTEEVLRKINGRPSDYVDEIISEYSNA